MARHEHTGATPPNQVDFVASDHGSIVTLRPLTDAARAWIADHLPDDAPRLGNAVGIEPRHVQPILEGIEDAGLIVADDD